MSNYLKSKFKIITLGCKINIFESESISSILSSNGYSPIQTIEEADIIIINTCTVTNKADAKSKNNIRRARKNNPDALIVVCGCLVNTDVKLLESFSEVDILLKNQDKDKIFEAISASKNHKYTKPFLYSGDIDGSFNFFPKVLQKHSRAFLKIQDGCNNNCSYCKIPQARGHERSRNIDDIITNINMLRKSGYREIIFSGINLGNYEYKQTRLPALLDRVIKEFPKLRFRISSIEPQYIDRDFLTIIQHKNICPHFHIPLQNGSNKILQSMNRRYTTDFYEETIKRLREVKDNPFISTDIILGFPGETQEDFESTLSLVNKIQFAFIHLFRYSKRNNTKAILQTNNIPHNIVKQRMDYLKTINLKYNQAYANSFINKEVEVIIESKKGNYFIGKSNNYLTVLIMSQKELEPKNSYNTIITKIEKNKIYGDLI